MERKGMIIKSADGLSSPTDQKPVIIRNEKCESEILRMLEGRSMTKNAIRSELIKIFGTDKTVSEKDDNKLFAYMGEALRRMTRDGTLILTDRQYSLAAKVAAKIDDINSILELKNSFLSRIHKKGGEFFELYFMNLLEKFVIQYGKTVTYNSTTGGSADGGIDGIMETSDPLGFRETIMVQTKNRLESTNETTVRGFYGAVCARQGSRGIFVTSSDFHPMAKKFLDSIDNCVGVNGEKLFAMATDVSYGICRLDGRLTIDKALFEVV
jgi:restriction endonuclease Mrr